MSSEASIKENGLEVRELIGSLEIEKILTFGRTFCYLIHEGLKF